MAPRKPLQRVVDSYHGIPCDYRRPDDCPVRPGEICGEIHEFCRAHKRRKTDPTHRLHDKYGDPCLKYAQPGQLICRHHGALAPQNQKAGEERMARDRALGEVGKLLAEALGVVEGMPGPEQMLLGINYAGAMMLSYRWLLDELPLESQWSWEENNGPQGSKQRWVVVTETGLVGPDAQGVQRLHAYEEGLRHWTRLHGALLKAAADYGLEERRQRFQQEQITTIGAAVRSIVEGLGRELDDPLVVPVVEQALRVIASGPAER